MMDIWGNLMDYSKCSTEELLDYKNKLSMEISKYDNLQNSKKLCLNSLYGCLGTRYFRFFKSISK